MNNYILELNNISKSFGSHKALDNVHFELLPGEVHALMGENGAGKSTFIKIITGVVKPDSGTILYNGEPIAPESTLESGDIGIAAIYQHATVFPDLSVTENIFMGREILTRLGTYNLKEMRRLAKEYIEPFSSDIDVNKPMSSLSVAQQQIVEIAKALSQHARVLILDEPTASLTKYECERLYEIVDHLREDGVSMIFITHRLEDMYRVASRVTVLRDAEYIGTWNVSDISNSDLIEAMVGRKLDRLYPEKTSVPGEEIFRVENLSRKGVFKDISFGVRSGEILVLTGLVGAGRTEVCEAIYGITHPDNGSIYLENKKLNIKSPSDAIGYGIGLLPENRLTQGLIGQMPIYENVTMADLNAFVRHGLLSSKDEIDRSIELCEKLELKARSVAARPSTLSGGNQQKVVIAKLLNCKLKVLIVDEPTKGIDVGAKYSVYETLNELAANGYAIVMVSSDMSEVLGMADRIIVMKRGRIAAEFDAGEATQDKILTAAIIDSGSSEGK